MGRWGSGFIALCLALFGYSSLLGWSWYGRCGVEWLIGGRGVKGYYFVFLLLTVLGSGMELSAVWHFSDCCNALMAWPSLIALWLWRREILEHRQKL
jgi:AGCS family alanine or glycine:cation symporter